MRKSKAHMYLDLVRDRESKKNIIFKEINQIRAN